MYTLVAEKPHFFGAYSFKAMLTWQYNDYSQWFNEYADNLTITTAHTAETTIKHTKPRRRIAYSGVRLCAWTAEKPYFKRFSGIEKVHRNSIKITVDLWRRARDSAHFVRPRVCSANYPIIDFFWQDSVLQKIIRVRIPCCLIKKI